MNLISVCAKCYRKQKPYEMEITRVQGIIVFYKCQCGGRWQRYIEPKPTVGVIGDHVPPSLQEQLRELLN